jgi:hypothetical protein
VTPITRMPAARAALTPAGASSSTTHSAGASPRPRAAARKTSGNGLLRSNSVPDTTQPKSSGVKPAAPRFASIWRQSEAGGACGGLAGGRAGLATTGGTA